MSQGVLLTFSRLMANRGCFADVQGTPPPQLTGLATGVADRAELLGEAAGWHRDAYSHHNMWHSGTAGWERSLKTGTQPFTPPLAAHMLCYLQDMSGPGGPLLAVPGSHRSDFGGNPIGNEEAVVQIDAKAGDAVFFHCDMLHSGSRNRASDGAWRYMVMHFLDLSLPLTAFPWSFTAFHCL